MMIPNNKRKCFIDSSHASSIPTILTNIYSCYTKSNIYKALSKYSKVKRNLKRYLWYGALLLKIYRKHFKCHLVYKNGIFILKKKIIMH